MFIHEVMILTVKRVEFVINKYDNFTKCASPIDNIYFETSDCE